MTQMKSNILIVSTDQSVTAPITKNFNASTCTITSEVIEKVEQKLVSFVVIDQDCCDLNALSLYRDIKNLSADLPTILVSSSVSISQVVEGTKLGMRDIIKKPFSPDQLVASIKSIIAEESGERIVLTIPPGIHWLAHSGGKVGTLIKMMEASIRERKNILFISEPGTDASLLADLISGSNPWGKKLSKLDMTQFQQDVNENVFWTMLQGYVSDANTIYLAHFDSVQQKTRSSILEYIRKRAGNNHVKILASVRDIVSTDEFADWIKMIVPSMRERKDDLAVMMNSYLRDYCHKYAKKIDCVSLDVLELFARYSWPGNYREFEAVLENAVLQCDGDTLSLKDVQLLSRMLPESLPEPGRDDLFSFRRNLERHLIDYVYSKTGSKEMTAHILDIPRTKVQEELI